MAELSERDPQFFDEDEEDNLEEEMDDQYLGSEDEEGAGGGKGKRLRESLVVPGKRGVCYLSRVPPHMNPSHVRQMLSKYGEVLRIYLVPEGNPQNRLALCVLFPFWDGMWWLLLAMHFLGCFLD
jgi:ESF2/ABP1 family protein